MYLGHLGYPEYLVQLTLVFPGDLGFPGDLEYLGLL